MQQSQFDHYRQYLNSWAVEIQLLCFVQYFILCVVSYCPIALVQHICKCLSALFFHHISKAMKVFFSSREKQDFQNFFFILNYYFCCWHCWICICNVAKKKLVVSMTWMQGKKMRKFSEPPKYDGWWLGTFCCYCCCYFSFPPPPPLSLSLPSISNLFLAIPTEEYFDGFFTQLVILQVNCRERATLSENFVAHSMLMGFVVFVGGRL